MGAIAVAAGAAILSALGIGFVFGHEHGYARRRKQIAVAYDAVSQVAHDVRTLPHTADRLKRQVLPLLTERQDR